MKKKLIYFDAAATTLNRPPVVISAMCDALNALGNAGRGACGPILAADRTIYRCRQQLQRLFNAPSARQVAFTMNATMSLNMAIKGLLRPGDHAIGVIDAHNSALRPLYEMEKAGCALTFLPCDSLGRLAPETLRRAIRPETKIFVCSHASNISGNIHDLVRFGRVCADNGIRFIVDAAQTAGLIPIDMEKMGIDVLCCSAHKALLGPQGLGMIILGKDVILRPLCSGGTGVQTYSHEQPIEMPARLEAGTLNAHGIAALSAALDYLDDYGQKRRLSEELHLARHFYQGLGDLKSLHYYGDYSDWQSDCAEQNHAHPRIAIVSFNHAQTDAEQLADALYQRYGICVRAGGHCAPLFHETFQTKGQGILRFSFSFQNTEEEVNSALRGLHELIG